MSKAKPISTVTPSTEIGASALIGHPHGARFAHVAHPLQLHLDPTAALPGLASLLINGSAATFPRPGNVSSMRVRNGYEKFPPQG
jgi:hypothetical protein